MQLSEQISEAIPAARSRFRYGRVSAIDDTTSPWLYTVDGRQMPMQASGLVVSDLVLYWDDPHNPVGFGKPVGA